MCINFVAVSKFFRFRQIIRESETCLERGVTSGVLGKSVLADINNWEPSVFIDSLINNKLGGGKNSF